MIEGKLDQIISGEYYESLIEKRIKNKAELSDVQALDKSKADISAMQELNEKVTRIEKMIEEGMLDEGKEEEDSMYSEDVDPEELKD